MEPDYKSNASFYDQLAGQYDSHLLSSPGDILARRAFQELVTSHVRPGGTILDLGCGTGLDALEYARRGYRVVAYDNSPGMVAQLRQRCQSEIASGAVTPHAMPYPTFLDSVTSWPKVEAISANFAVLNSIRELGPLFDKLSGRVAVDGHVIVSVLNPVHWSLIKTGGWWRNALRAPLGPRNHTTHPYVSYLHLVSEIRRAATGFRLIGRAHAGAVVRYHASGAADRLWQDETHPGMRGRLWHSPAYRLLGHFLFLVLRRNP